MNTKIKLISFLAMFFIVFYCTSCVQKVKESENAGKIENTLKSVHLMRDSIGIDPSLILSYFDRVNKAIDSIGYPDAGYNLWIVQSDTVKDLRFLVEGNWPNQAIYDTIHNHVLFKNITPTQDEEKLFDELKRISYNRFTLVK
jgi:hypothetical protein